MNLIRCLATLTVAAPTASHSLSVSRSFALCHRYISWKSRGTAESRKLTFCFYPHVRIYSVQGEWDRKLPKMSTKGIGGMVHAGT
jgi:hypothetical protein